LQGRGGIVLVIVPRENTDVIRESEWDAFRRIFFPCFVTSDHAE
jgi:hypothetical protein